MSNSLRASFLCTSVDLRVAAACLPSSCDFAFVFVVGDPGVVVGVIVCFDAAASSGTMVVQVVSCWLE